LGKNGKVAEGTGHYYSNDAQIRMVEFHVDDSVEFPKMLNHIPFRGMLSVRKPPEVKPFICFGHDECIFKQFILTGKSRKGPNGETAVVPKDDRAGVMISVFQSHEFGFGLHLTYEQLKEVNKYCEGKFYLDADASMATRQSKQKKNTYLYTVHPRV
jgi:hypothetical protein